MTASALTGLFECVVNASEGRDDAVVAALGEAAGAALLDMHADADHGRCVITIGGPADTVEHAVRRVAQTALEQIDVSGHRGAHPRLGALDVVPFVALDPDERSGAVDLARRCADWIGGSLGVPVFLYGDAHPDGRSLPDVRRGAFTSLAPDAGPARPSETAGAVVVGARPPLVAVNCELATDDLDLAKAIAAEIRERGGGLPGVRALGFPLASRRRVQVSMNLVDPAATGVEEACNRVRDVAERSGAGVARVELVGLLPAAELERTTPEFRTWARIGTAQTIEARMRAAGWLAGEPGP